MMSKCGYENNLDAFAPHHHYNITTRAILTRIVNDECGNATQTKTKLIFPYSCRSLQLITALMLLKQRNINYFQKNVKYRERDLMLQQLPSTFIVEK